MNLSYFVTSSSDSILTGPFLDVDCIGDCDEAFRFVIERRYWMLLTNQKFTDSRAMLPSLPTTGTPPSHTDGPIRVQIESYGVEQAD